MRLFSLLSLMLIGAGVAAGTTVVAVRSGNVLRVAVDSTENYFVYGDQARVVQRPLCKVGKPGPFVAIVAGISHGTNGFDALAETEQAWRPGEGLDALTAHVRERVPQKLAPLLQSLYTADPDGFESRFRGQAVVQLLLAGEEDGTPQVRIVEFIEHGAGNAIALSIRQRGCPEECSRDGGMWLLGTHDRIDRLAQQDPAMTAEADPDSLERLVRLEEAEHPDLVGGPVSIVEVTEAGASLVRRGVCGLVEAAMPVRLLDEHLLTLDNLILRESVSRYAESGGRVSNTDRFELTVNVADGQEQYSEVRRGDSLYSNVSQIDGTWSFGEMVTMLRTTREALGTQGPEPGQTRFAFSAADRRWFVKVGAVTHWLDFDGCIRVSRETGAIEHIEWTALHPPAASGLARIVWTVDFRPLTIGGREISVPSLGTYRVERRGIGHRAEWNITEFSVAGMFGSKSEIHFGDF
jgi:hypothetical protein